MAEGTRVSQLIETVSGMKQQQEAQQQNQQNQPQILEDIVQQIRNMSTSVARVRRRGDRPPTLMCVSGAYEETRNSCLYITKKREWESPPSLWLLGTLTGLRDQVRRLIA